MPIVKGGHKRHLAVTFLGTPGAVAAAIFLEKYPEAELMISSQNRLIPHLSALDAGKVDQLYILGVGTSASEREVVETIGSLLDKGINITWLHNWEDLAWVGHSLAQREGFQFLVRPGANIARVVADFIGLDSPNTRKLLGIVERNQEREKTFEYRLALYGIHRYLDLRDDDSYPAVVRMLADPSLISEDLRDSVTGFEPPGRRFLGKSPQAVELLEIVGKVAADPDCSVLVQGETGTGKEVVARLIHHYSPSRRHYHFWPLNCACLSETLLESELFGHLRGSFTGAVKDKEGILEKADKGTVFLDEIGEMSITIQARLLRVLEERQFTKVGSTEHHSVDVRIIAATNRNLAEQVRKGRFREDLYYRLNVVSIHTPPLRERIEDITLLAQDCLERLAEKKKKDFHELTKKCLDQLKSYSWPGNVRELQNVLERAMILDQWDFGWLLTEQLKREDTSGPAGYRGIVPLDEYKLRYVMQVYKALGKVKAHTAEALQITPNTLKAMLAKAEEMNSDI